MRKTTILGGLLFAATVAASPGCTAPQVQTTQSGGTSGAITSPTSGCGYLINLTYAYSYASPAQMVMGAALSVTQGTADGTGAFTSDGSAPQTGVTDETGEAQFELMVSAGGTPHGDAAQVAFTDSGTGASATTLVPIACGVPEDAHVQDGSGPSGTSFVTSWEYVVSTDPSSSTVAVSESCGYFGNVCCTGAEACLDASLSCKQGVCS